MNADLTKTLLQMAAQTALEKLTKNPLPPGQSSPDAGVENAGPAAGPETLEATAAETLNPGPTERSQPTIPKWFKDIGVEAASAVTEGLSSHVGKNMEKTIQVAELAIERQRIAALREMQAVLHEERSKAVEELRKTAELVSKRLFAAATVMGASLLTVAAALLLNR